jgi:hypothetical protein
MTHLADAIGGRRFRPPSGKMAKTAFENERRGSGMI